MNRIRKVCLLCALVNMWAVLLFLIPLSALSSPVSLDELALDLSSRKDPVFVFTNKQAAFWFGQATRANQGAYQGYTCFEQRVLKDYQIQVNGMAWDRQQADRTVLYPDRLVREYAAGKETFYFVDSLQAILVSVQLNQPSEVTLLAHWDRILLTTHWRWEDAPPVAWGEAVEMPPGKPRYLAFSVWGNHGMVTPIRATGQGAQAAEFAEGPEFFQGLRVSRARDLWFLILFADSMQSLQRQLTFCRKNVQAVLNWRRERIQQLFRQSLISLGDPFLDKAYRWARISLDDLITHQKGPGIWAGLPWFNNYWGRDTFISFTGALLCTGQYALARKILENFAAFQNSNPLSREYGRIPNRITLKETIYNTADATPWFVIACQRYLQYTGDHQFREQMFPTLKKALEGAMDNFMDEYGFLTHGDAETWMDAVGSEGPWSPRGNRAVEIQVLWLEQLRISAQWAEKLGYRDWASQWRIFERRARHSFAMFFWDRNKKRLVDHLNPDNSPDPKIRPNVLFALTLPRDSLLNASRAEAVLREVTGQLTFPWGVATLDQQDPDFHPYHHYPPYYVPDAAYHNGLVWTWLSGPLISALLPRNRTLAWQLLREEARQILERNAPGSQSELLEAWPRPGSEEPRISGTVSQAWNLAEFIRNWHQDVLGIHPFADSALLQFVPQLPEPISQCTFHFPFRGGQVKGQYRHTGQELILMLEAMNLSEPLTVELAWPGKEKMVVLRHRWSPRKALILRLSAEHNRYRGWANQKSVHLTTRPAPRPLPDLAFARPTMDMSIPAFQGPAYDLIPPEEALQRPSRLTRVLFDIGDEKGDDRGPTGEYVYPTHPAFAPGIFDGRRVVIRRDESYMYFEIKLENLVNPGWHPEAGFQLTYLAICLNFGDRAGVRTNRVGMNANFSVPLEYAFNFVIYVGNGYRIVDGRGRTIAEFRPGDPSHALGDVKEKVIRFSVPLRYLSTENLRNAVVLIGGQDDHGGGGLGEFRSVLPEPGEWHGGGGKKPRGNPSVYDVIFLRR